MIVAAGSAPRSLGIPGEASFLGKGVSHCASCDGPFFKGEEVVVVGGGDSALDEALVLAAHAARVTVVHRGASLARSNRCRARVGRSQVAILLDTVVEEIVGGDAVSGVRLRDRKSGETRLQPVKGVFVYVGLEPNTAFLQGVVALDGAGHIETDAMMRTSRRRPVRRRRHPQRLGRPHRRRCGRRRHRRDRGGPLSPDGGVIEVAVCCARMSPRGNSGHAWMCFLWSLGGIKYGR